MWPTYTDSIRLCIKKTPVRAENIDVSIFENYKRVLAVFSLKDKLGRILFFEKTLLVANISIKIIIGMLFFLFSNIDVQFMETERITWRNHIVATVLFSTKSIELINKKEFAATVLD